MKVASDISTKATPGIEHHESASPVRPWPSVYLDSASAIDSDAWYSRVTGPKSPTRRLCLCVVFFGVLAS